MSEGEGAEDADPLFEEALLIVRNSKSASASFLQRRLQIGYNRAARLIETMESRGIVGPADGAKPREILLP
jgi:S-DNA-T family DNA segregation ATPase FtsK/SpoIIIE